MPAGKGDKEVIHFHLLASDDREGSSIRAGAAWKRSMKGRKKEMKLPAIPGELAGLKATGSPCEGL